MPARPLAAIFAGLSLVVVGFPGCASTPQLIVQPLSKSSGSLGQADAQLAAGLQQAEANYHSALTGKSPEAQAAYDAAVAQVINAMSLKASSREWVAPVDAGRYQLRFGPDNKGKPFWMARRWNAIVPAAKVKEVHAATRLTGAGFGCPVILFMEATDDLLKRYPALPQNGIHLPATAVLTFGKPPRNGGPRPVELLLVNTRDTSVATISGQQVQLAYDLTAPIEMQFRNKFVENLGLSGLLFPDKNTNRAGIFGTQPYDRNKIPVLFVHGLNSDPHIWEDAMNAVVGDPVLRTRYQLWYFIYPTGLAVPVSANLLRTDLVRTRREFDPNGDDPGMNNMVLIGHSMGGIISHMQVVDSGEDFRKAYFTKPIEQLNVTEEYRARLKAGLYFEHLPWIKRSVYVATPHRGAKLADLRIVRLLVRLIRLPLAALTLTTQILTLNADALNPELSGFNGLGASGVETLSPKHPYFKALDARPIFVPYHSIIGDRGRGNTPNSSDGVVPYWSSHLDGAQSEVIVPGPHSCTSYPQTVEEIRRVLRLHLKTVESRKGTKPKIEEIIINPKKT
ncbi:hypothetical protein AYO41_00830 [Verrucomicrobia bacterium SCGC AG-212-E04]|nr:hypothetical protein AYO41_00830 [Verrucomicrobia bacterium SCGC AG-212-E04]